MYSLIPRPCQFFFHCYTFSIERLGGAWVHVYVIMSDHNGIIMYMYVFLLHVSMIDHDCTSLYIIIAIDIV